MNANQINTVIFYLCYIATTIHSIKQSIQTKSSSGAYQKCSISEFSCLNGKCISASQFCDNIDNCGDASDEPRFCTNTPN
ncbi:CLUMA_CG010727, isoform A [Clunio marinus]|uniref:CLUMA_CG010727, isoform A n=1 Tax=Clunio marinus TaxID=568069 RepID=A0A1J1IEA7_9DIPT|nr:CLUMA_CG010727, isoform A [Clunio marinus]